MYIRIYIGRGFKLVTLEDQDEKRAKRSSPLRWHGPSTPSPPAFTSGEASSVWYTHRHPSLKQPSRGRATVLILMERLMGELKGRKLKENKRRDSSKYSGAKPSNVQLATNRATRFLPIPSILPTDSSSSNIYMCVHVRLGVKIFFFSSNEGDPVFTTGRVDHSRVITFSYSTGNDCATKHWSIIHGSADTIGWRKNYAETNGPGPCEECKTKRRKRRRWPTSRQLGDLN